MKVYDLHCDVLYKLAKAETPISFANSSLLQANKEALEVGQVALQLFAVFVSEGFPKEKQFMEAIRQIEFFYTEIVGKHDNVVAINKWEQLESLKEGQIGAVLSLEGLDMIDGNLLKLKLLLSHGVKLVGLTWNGANEVADGVVILQKLHTLDRVYQQVQVVCLQWFRLFLLSFGRKKQVGIPLGFHLK